MQARRSLSSWHCGAPPCAQRCQHYRTLNPLRVRCVVLSDVQMLDYTVPGGKLNRGLTVLHSLGLILGRELTAEEARKASVLGWCIEWVRHPCLWPHPCTCAPVHL